MLRLLFLNTAVSGVVFAVSSVLVLWLVPRLVAAYGLSGFGLIMLARTLLPTGFAALFDFGVSEVVTQAVARARASGNWHSAGAQVALLTLASTAIGAVLSLALWLLAPAAVDLFRIDAANAASFEVLMRASALALLLLFPALISEGIVKGFEAYWALRIAELLPTIGYVVAALVLVARGAGYHVIAYAFLVSILVRAIATAAIAWTLGREAGLRPRRWSPAERADAFARCRVMFAGKAVSAVQTQGPPLVIGMLVGPAGVGAYDVLVRLPRFAKSVLGLLMSLLMPIGARLEETGDARNQRRLASAGTVFVPIVVLPLLAGGAAFSAPILALWLGPAFRDYWPWHAAMFLVPALGVVVSFGSTVLMSRTDAARQLVRLAGIMVLVQYVLSIALSAWLGERAFILGQVVSALLLFPLQIRFMLIEQGVGSRLGRRLALLLAGLSALAALTSVWSARAVQDVPSLIGWGGAWVLLCWVALGLLMLSPAEREAVLRRVKGLSLR